jgi:deoxycytidine triphosphate deaminase
MILSSRQIKDAITNYDLITPDDEQMTNVRLRRAWQKGVARVEGVNFELSLGKVMAKVPSDEYRPEFIGVESRQTPEYDEIPSNGCDWWELGPGFYQAQTFESINQPLFLASRLVEKRTVITFGCSLILADVSPGYSGKLGVGLVVFPGCSLTIEKGALFMSISFAKIGDADGVEAWNGVWKDSKMFLDKTERPR